MVERGTFAVGAIVVERKHVGSGSGGELSCCIRAVVRDDEDGCVVTEAFQAGGDEFFFIVRWDKYGETKIGC